MKTALITGIAGQDGAYLAKLLLEKGYNVSGIAKPRTPLDNLKKLGLSGIAILEGDITDPSSVDMAIKVSRPDEIYNLAAQSHVGYSFNAAQVTASVNYMGYLNVLLAARSIVPRAKIYQAGTSEMFGYTAGLLANEDTPLQPKSPYAVAKVAAHWAGVNARNEADQFVSNGLLFNHESPLREKSFVTRKITQAVARIARGEAYVLRLGNIDSIRDWGYAGDYVDAMWRILQQDKPDDFVVATGEVNSVRHFVMKAFKAAGMDIEFEGEGLEEKGYVRDKFVFGISSEFYRSNDLTYLCGDASKAKSVLGWEPKISFDNLVKMMMESDLENSR